MSKDISPETRMDLSRRLWQLAHTNPGEMVEKMHTSDLAVEIRHSGLDLSIQQAQDYENTGEKGKHE